MKSQGAEGYSMSESQLRSRAPNGKPAARVGAQSKISMTPGELVPWSTFDEEVGLATKLVSKYLQVLVKEGTFKTQQVHTTRSWESSSIRRSQQTLQ